MREVQFHHFYREIGRFPTLPVPSFTQLCYTTSTTRNPHTIYACRQLYPSVISVVRTFTDSSTLNTFLPPTTTTHRRTSPSFTTYLSVVIQCIPFFFPLLQAPPRPATYTPSCVPLLLKLFLKTLPHHQPICELYN
uniref:Uncharacterized protein n=1 Tax=Trypanosoma vivax (strain Y486) TaxID=1055687 RepID=G0TUD5_TRYVY|nr:hypothetical protein TVY486_0402350 [Trypanosoma vivax Y486]